MFTTPIADYPLAMTQIPHQISHQTKTRALLKAVLWTLMGLLVMIGVGFAMTGSLATGGKMAVINSVIGMVTYFLYERLWDRISWGRLGGTNVNDAPF